ncbi:hypothetical protein H696_06089 [Fonticula alba]|uniref:AAA+ ATPase domain-containing protein n=1 Tax=Fonticula alba TaxID=691883 RepID=A0A058YZP5_FONAL|nr:hypothetical protein H696_06089 [Fonticula alba]KCV67450.1 hypothetical protein H696_06089 [Fonticula alba]|eukprot:XP_009498126.1 hypothetical protein H696_06089 [Fonticula alba]
MVAALLTLMDGVESQHDGVVVIAATNRPDSLDPALRRPGRFDRELSIGAPDAAARGDILRKALARTRHRLAEEDLLAVADKCHGFVGADMALLVEEAGLSAVGRFVQAADVPAADQVAELCLELGDFQLALQRVKPSSLRSVALSLDESARVYWRDIGGQEDAKQRLREAIEWPLKNPEAFRRLGIRPPRGILLYGPPGCSKTLLARALATESGVNFIAIKGPEIFNKWVGESERAVREIFRRARGASPAIIFLDEVDAIASKRGSSSGESSVSDRVVSQLLSEIDGIEGLDGVTIVAATNRPDIIDPALMRPGRLDRKFLIDLPDHPARVAILQRRLRDVPHDEQMDLDDLATRLEGYSGAETVAVCREAALAALNDAIAAADAPAKESIRREHFDRALATVRPRISPAMMDFYRGFAAGGAVVTASW